MNGARAALLVLLVFAAPRARAVTVRAEPDTAWLEPGRGLQRVHVDFRFEHQGPDTLELSDVVVSAYDAGGRFLARRFVAGNGTAPSILTLPARTVSAGHPLLVFNPFAEWDAALPLARLRYRFILESAARAETVHAEVRPREFRQRTDLILPLAGRVFVFDAHDGLAHHRRLDTTFPVIAKLGLTRNPGRYAYDLSVVDEAGSMWRTDGKRNEDWYSWGVPVRAPGAGKVVAAVNDRPDWEVGRTQLPIDDILRDPNTLTGNVVVIDHGNGEFSLLAHMRRGSVRVRAGDTVKQGDTIGLVGYSGSVFTVHVHYELRTGAGLVVEGLPSRFSRLDRWIGDRRVPVSDGFIDTGDVIESR